MSYYIDSHCHLDLLKDIQQNVLAEDNLPIKSIAVTNAPFIFEHSRALFKHAKNIRIALGMHPELIQQYHSEISSFAKWISATRYIGEIGLDGSSRFKESLGLQVKVLSEILTLCKEADQKILTVHTRSAAKETIQLLHSHLKNSNCKVILHWYSGNQFDLDEALQHGYFFSVNHRMTSSENGKKIIASIPMDRLLTETDAPFSFDYRLKTRLQSLQETIKNLAVIKNKTQEEIRQVVFDNFAFLLR